MYKYLHFFKIGFVWGRGVFFSKEEVYLKLFIKQTR